jgi:hypothetical protein
MNIAEIERKLARAQEDVGGFGAEYAEASLDALNGKPGAQNRVDSIEAEHARAAALVKQLSAALAAAKARDEEELRANRAALRKTQTAACKAHLNARDRAAEAMSTALLETARQWKLLVEHSEKAQNATPIGTRWPEGDAAASAYGELVRLVTREMRLASHNAGLDTHHRIPGAAPIDDVLNVLPLVTMIKQASVCAIAAITGKPAA